jgi:pyruvate-formate lyase-activating enzyme
MRVSKCSDNHIIKELTFTDGFGYLAPIIFFQGCDIHCPDCHNEQLWDFDGGDEVSIEEITEEILQYTDKYEAVVYMGGEPTSQLDSLKRLMEFAKYFSLKNILYTGRDISELDEEVLELADIIKFGQYGKTQYVWKKEEDTIEIFRKPGV